MAPRPVLAQAPPSQRTDRHQSLLAQAQEEAETDQRSPEDPAQVREWINRANELEAKGAYADAAALWEKVLAIREKVLGPEHPATATSLNNLAALYQAQDSYAAAEPLYKRALAIREQVLGPEHPDTASSLNSLAVLYEAQGDHAKAVPLLVRGIGRQALFLQRQVPFLPSERRQAQVRVLGFAWEAAFSFADQGADGASLALFSRLNRHGLLQRIEQREALLRRASGPQQPLVQRIQAINSRLAAASLPAEQRTALSEERQSLERQLSGLLPPARLVQPQEVARALPADALLVEFQRYRPLDGSQAESERWGPPRYLALVLAPDATITPHDLGPAAPIDALIGRALTATDEHRPDADALWGQVSQTLFTPLLPQLQEARRWLLAPDGELHRVPFAALRLPGLPQRLGEARPLCLLTTGRDLLSPPATSSANAPLVLADPALGAGWGNALHTPTEGPNVASHLKVSPVRGAAASEATLRARPSPRLLHIASHGYFESGTPASDTRSSATNPTPTTSPSTTSSPAPTSSPATLDQAAMLRNAIVLSGARQADIPVQRPDPDDGHLTPFEVTKLQLTGTQLVTLSACETGQGAYKSGEGLYGLQRALKVAGAQSSLLALWNVSADATEVFMDRYYSLLIQGVGRMDALIQVQNEFQRNPLHNAWRHPKFWAAWQLVGDTGPLTP